MSLTEEESLSWTETPSGLWSRGLDATEKHFLGMGVAGKPYGREFGFLSIVMKIDFGGAEPTSAARNAWLSLRFRYPLLASSLDGLKRIYRAATEEELKSWLRETFITYPDRSPDHGAEELRLELRPVRRAQLHVLPQSREIILHVGHDVLDGLAMLYFVDTLLEEISNPTQNLAFGSEVANLPPPLRLAANIPPVTKQHEDQIKQALAEWFAALPWLSIRATNADKPPGNTKAQRQKLTPAQSAQVITAAKEKGFSPTHVVEAAAILAVVAQKPDTTSWPESDLEVDRGSSKAYGSCGIFSMRQQCDPRWREAVIPYLTIYPLVVRPTDFLSTAAQLKAYYAGLKADMPNLLCLVEPTFNAFAGMAQTPPPPGSNRMISLSSIGRFEPALRSVHGKIKLDDLWLMYETPNAVVNSFLWTRDGMLSWQVVYNEVYYEEETIAQWIATTKQILFEELRIRE